MKKLILIKLGGSLITDKTKPYTAKPKLINRLGREIREALAKCGNIDLELEEETEEEE